MEHLTRKAIKARCKAVFYGYNIDNYLLKNSEKDFYATRVEGYAFHGNFVRGYALICGYASMSGAKSINFELCRKYENIARAVYEKRCYIFDHYKRMRIIKYLQWRLIREAIRTKQAS